jgi:CHAT domain-containing protein
LIREYQVGYVPSLSSLRVLRQRRQNGSKPKKDLLAIGDAAYGAEGRVIVPDLDILYGVDSSTGISLPPLKYSALEIQSISRLFPKNKVTVLEKQDASERWLKSNPLTDYRIIHFATHSLIDDKKPARSAILLSFNTGRAGEGLLQTRDIYNLKMNAELVTLSACQTGLGQFIRGEGIEGLSRAFFYAGSSSVLMSLWAVNDQATSLLMERFYRHLRGSESLMGALRNAKLDMIRSAALSHPYYWGGFVINGKADSGVYSRGLNLMMIMAGSLGISMITVLAIVTYRRRKR